MADEYDVGYGKPPKEHRFQKGVGGPRKGRRVGERNFKTDLKEVLEEQITIRDAGKTYKVSKQKAGLKMLVNKALGGNVRALEFLVQLARQNSADERSPSERPLPDEDRAIIEAFLGR
jgi:hypothetical protein